MKRQKQPSIGFLWKRCSENMQQTYRRAPMPKCDVNKVVLELYWNCTSTWVFSSKFAACFQNAFLKNTSGWLLLKRVNFILNVISGISINRTLYKADISLRRTVVYLGMDGFTVKYILYFGLVYILNSFLHSVFCPLNCFGWSKKFKIYRNLEP